MAAVDVHPVGALALPAPYLLFVGDVTEPGYAKTAFGSVADPMRPDLAFDRLVDACLA